MNMRGPIKYAVDQITLPRSWEPLEETGERVASAFSQLGTRECAAEGGESWGSGSSPPPLSHKTDTDCQLLVLPISAIPLSTPEMNRSSDTTR